jgi:arylsulfatase A-like enzyme
MLSSLGKGLLVGAACIAAAAWLGCRSHGGERPNVILVVIDTLRADAVRPGDADSPMPFLSDLATRSVYYERAHSPSSWTLPSMGTLFLATYPSQHRMGSGGWKDKMASGTTLAEVLRNEGYVTAARVAHPFLKRGKVGRGFDDFAMVSGGPKEKGGLAALTDVALAWIDAPDRSKSPFFLYLHYIEPHNPYRVYPEFTAPRGSFEGRPDRVLGYSPGEGILTESEEERRAVWNYTEAEVKRMRQLYDGEVRYVDRNLEVLFDTLSEKGVLKQSIVVVTSDHGEEFGEHGVFGHGASLFGAVVRVPLIIVLPDGSRSRVRTPVQTGGLGPTLLGELGIRTPDAFAIPPFSLREDPTGVPAVHLDLPFAPQLKLRLHRSGVLSDSAKLLVSDDGTEHFYRLTVGGMESVPAASLPQADDLRSALAALRGLAAGERPEAEDLDAEQMEQLRELGYAR